MRARNYVLTAAAVLVLAAPSAAQTVRPTESHWLASAFVGSSFGEELDGAGPNFGGTVGYLWRGIVGAEFQANLSPEMDLDDSRTALLFGEEPWLNSYMGNAIAAVPLGSEGQWRPYVSGGVGIFTLAADALETADDARNFGTDDARVAGNLGVGLMAFAGRLGFRGDARYFNGFGKPDIEANDLPHQVIGKEILSSLGFWRVTGGVAVRF
jgi:hypothetical protein